MLRTIWKIILQFSKNPYFCRKIGRNIENQYKSLVIDKEN
ncbi:hypothetical protein Emtol_3070 [Emticicia oligotrophica DSM 17448]|uniref:Uncharacterized protein n=1 Tax=Emticicia oligotrophica (strain DSM 17448 / CIP 109782 / MTCC 6937 / GPTSA100-15) TaxID=929562 RepID=A0ABM5N476_EMTOG|nr:hypothetical protein Emtol_3070 [Emticicia oligotrophica DSM 17448]